MSNKKLLVLSISCALSAAIFSANCQEQNTPKDETLEWVEWALKEVQKPEFPASDKFKQYAKNTEPKILEFCKEQIEKEKIRKEKYLAKMKAIEEKHLAQKEHRSTLEQLEKVLKQEKQYNYSSSITHCMWHPECNDCQELVFQARGFLEYSQALLIQERIDLLQKEITKHPTDKDLVTFLEKEKQESLQQLHKIPNHQMATNKKPYPEALDADKREKLQTTIENLSKKHSSTVGATAEEYVKLRDLFNKK